MNKPYVFLDSHGAGDLGLCLIVEYPTGVEYGHQCGGYLCEERVTEGYLVPLGQREIELRIYEFFDREFSGHCYQPRNDWTGDRIAQLNKLLAQIPCSACARDGSGTRRAASRSTSNESRNALRRGFPCSVPSGEGC